MTALIKTHAIPDSVCLLCAAAAGEHLHHNIICTVYNNIICVYGRSPRRWKSHVHNIYMNAYNMSARTNRRKAYNIVCTKRTWRQSIDAYTLYTLWLYRYIKCVYLSLCTGWYVPNTLNTFFLYYNALEFKDYIFFFDFSDFFVLLEECLCRNTWIINLIINYLLWIIIRIIFITVIILSLQKFKRVFSSYFNYLCAVWSACTITTILYVHDKSYNL